MMLGSTHTFELLREIAQAVIPAGGSAWLYGSRARGDAKDDSDWDILILLNKNRIEKEDYDNVGFPFTELGWTMGEMIIPVLYTVKEWEQNSFTPFYKNVERDKVTVV